MINRTFFTLFDKIIALSESPKYVCVEKYQQNHGGGQNMAVKGIIYNINIIYLVKKSVI